MRVFRFFESLLEPTGPPPGPPPAGLGAFYWHHARQARGLVVALFVAGFAVAVLDTLIPVFIGRVVTRGLAQPPGAGAPYLVAAAGRHGRGAAGRPAIGAAAAEPDHQPGDRRRPLQHGALAKPLARGAPELDLFPERFRRPHRQSGHADRTGTARERRLGHQRGLVHPGLRQWCDDPARPQRCAPRGAGAAVVCRLCGAAAVFCAAAADPLAARFGDAFDLGRPGRRQLHQHPDGQAVRPGTRRGRVCPRGGRRADRCVPRPIAPDDRVRRGARRAQRLDGGRHRGGRASGCGAAAGSPSAPSRWRCR